MSSISSVSSSIVGKDGIEFVVGVVLWLRLQSINVWLEMFEESSRVKTKQRRLWDYYLYLIFYITRLDMKDYDDEEEKRAG